MIGMILCGGYGKRLQAFAPDLPKVLLEIKDGYTILDKQLRAYANAGFDQVLLLTGYLSEKIEERYGSEYKGLKLDYVVEEEPLGTLNAIRLGMEKVKEDPMVMVSNGDIVTDLNLKRMWNDFKSKSKSLVSMFLVKMPSPYGVVEVEDGYVTSFKEKPILDHYINGGFYCFSTERQLIDLLEEFKIGDVEETIFPRLAASKQLVAHVEEVPFWSSVDGPKDLENVKKEQASRIDKPWGFEKVLVLTENRLVKELYIMEGYRTSVHYHNIRRDELHFTDGEGVIEFKDSAEPYTKWSIFNIPPHTQHSIIPKTDTRIFEVSTPPKDEDIVRVKDFYPAR